MVAAAQAPAFAASPDRILRTNGRVTQTRTSTITSAYYVRWRSATVDSAVPYPGVRLTNLRTADRMADISHTLWLRRSDARFQLESGATANGWSTPTHSGQTRVVNGVTYYGYTSRYSGAIPNPDANGVVYVRGANWQANYTSGWSSRSSGYMVSVDAKINGSDFTYSTGVITFP